MRDQPLYSSADQNPAYALRFTWCGWSSKGPLPQLPDDAWATLVAAWETDGLRPLERELKNETILVTFSTTPKITPVLLASRAKGRLQHAFRLNGKPVDFSRKVAVRSVGENTTEAVENYIQSQIRNAEFMDPKFAEFLEQFTVLDRSVDLSLPTELLSGRYWYNLHLVLVTDGRYRFVDAKSLTTLRDGSMRIAAKKGYRIGSLSVMPDHLHVALRGNMQSSPEEIALAFQNNLAYMLRKGPIWRNGYYAGTFGEYNMNAIRNSVR
jgi:REP element-mobilizing transposase RayT